MSKKVTWSHLRYNRKSTILVDIWQMASGPFECLNAVIFGRNLAMICPDFLTLPKVKTGVAKWPQNHTIWDCPTGAIEQSLPQAAKNGRPVKVKISQLERYHRSNNKPAILPAIWQMPWKEVCGRPLYVGQGHKDVQKVTWSVIIGHRGSPPSWTIKSV